MLFSVNKHQSGFTFVELAVVLLIVGILIAGFLVAIKPVLYQARLSATEANMNRVIDVLSVYAQRNNRLPCPADPDTAAAGTPYGAEAGSGAAGANAGDCDDPAAGERVEGIVPFKTLGMNLDDVKDGWGNMITYRVSPVFARNPAAANQAHMRCRTDNVWVSGGSARQPAKARFCCPDLTVPAVTDIQIKDQNGNPMWLIARDTKSASYDAVNTAYTGSTAFDVTNDNVTTIAFVLASHGSNEAGAFLANGTRIGPAGTASPAETENLNGDRVFVAQPRSMTGNATHFDDVLMWRTQDQIYAETGAGSCSFP